MADDTHDPKPPATPLTFERVLEILEKGVVDTEHGIMRWSSNRTFLVSIVLDELSVLSVYKPRTGERPLWDFPDGTLCLREQAAFLTSQALGWQLVPPTVLREGVRGLGSFQFFVDHDPEQNYFTFDKTFAPQLMRISLFDCLVNNADRKGGHCLLDAQGHIWGIDHGITFNSVHKLRTVIWDFAGEPISDLLLTDIEKLCVTLTDSAKSYRQSLEKLLSKGEIEAFQARIQRLLKSRRYPKPGSGPNYPWPPV